MGVGLGLVPPPSPLGGVKVPGLTACAFCENCGVENGGVAGDEYVPAFPAVNAEYLAILASMAGFT